MEGFFCRVYALSRPRYFFVGSAVLAVVLWLLGNQEEALYFSVSLLVTFGIVGALKIILRVPRPKNPMVKTYGYAFPSGHAAASAFLVVGLYYLSKALFNTAVAHWIVVIMLAITLIVSISRVYLHAHTTLQVLVGALIGFVVPLTILINYANVL